MVNREDRLDRIERALVAIGDYVQFEGRRGSHYEELRTRLSGVLEELRDAVGDDLASSTALSGRNDSAAPGQDMDRPRESGGDVSEGHPTDMPSTYLERVPTKPRELEAS